MTECPRPHIKPLWKILVMDFILKPQEIKISILLPPFLCLPNLMEFLLRLLVEGLLPWSPASRGRSIAPASCGGSVAPASHGRSVAPASCGRSVAPASRGRSVAPASHGRSISLASRGRFVTLASHGGSIALASRDGSVTPASHGGSVAPASRGGSVAPTSHGSMPPISHSVPISRGGSTAPSSHAVSGLNFHSRFVPASQGAPTDAAFSFVNGLSTYIPTPATTGTLQQNTSFNTSPNVAALHPSPPFDFNFDDYESQVPDK